jgi:predicted N-acetyltransferase YhbS
VEIRVARPEEAEELSALAFRSKAHWGYPEDFMEACRAELTVDEAYLRRNPTHVLEENGRVVGFHALLRQAAEEVELDFLFVEPEWIGRGCGGRLAAHALRLARELGYARVVVVGDPHADAFYRRMGGTPAGVRASESISGRELPVFLFELGAEL